jgi:hypothetical protein
MPIFYLPSDGQGDPDDPLGLACVGPDCDSGHSWGWRQGLLGGLLLFLIILLLVGGLGGAVCYQKKTWIFRPKAAAGRRKGEGR